MREWLGAITTWVVSAFALGGALYVILSYTTAFLFRPEARKGAYVLRAALVELATVVVLVPLWPLWWMLGAVYRAKKEGVGEAVGRRNPIILLHGFAMNRTQWVWMARGLIARGHGPIYGLNYFSLASVESAAKKLAKKVERVCERERCEQVDLVAHSLGGLVARYYIEQLNGAGRVGRLVTIGTPHRGTRLARFGLLLPAARDLRFESPFIGALGTVREGAAYTSIWSRADAIIQPADSSSIVPGGTDAIFDDLGHLSLVLSPRVVDLVDGRLRA